jgi:hypothetical protein
MTLKVGDRVIVKSGKAHDDMTMNKAGTVVEISTPALAINFDGMDKVHKWYTDGELTHLAKPAAKSKPM